MKNRMHKQTQLIKNDKYTALIKINKILAGIVIVAAFFLVFGLSYSYFTAGITGNEEATTITIESGHMQIDYNGGPGIEAIDIAPSVQPFATKVFTLTGTNTIQDEEMGYKISLVIDENTFQDISYTLSSENTSSNGEVAEDSTERQSLWSGSYTKTIGFGVFKGKVTNAVHTYTLKVYFYETGENQSYDMNKTFKAHINITNEIGYSNMLASENLSITGSAFDLLETESMLERQEEKFLEGPIQRNEIEEIKFVTNNIVPNNVLGSWDVSAKKDGSVMGWYEASATPGLYKITIGQNGGVRANLDSTALFAYLAYTKKIDVTNLNVSQVENATAMFLGLGYYRDDEGNEAGLEMVNIYGLEAWDVSSVTNMAGMFTGFGLASNSIKLDLSNWDVSKVNNFDNIFGFAGVHSTNFNLNISNWEVLGSPTKFEDDVSTCMFLYTGAMSVGFTLNANNWKISNNANLSHMFSLSGLASNNYTINVKDWNIPKGVDLSYMFFSVGGVLADTTSVSTNFNLNANNWNISNDTNLSYMFALTGIGVNGFTIDVSNWDVSKVTDMSGLFSVGEELIANQDITVMTIGDWEMIGLEAWDVSSVTNMSRMFAFAGMTATEINLDFSAWNTAKVIDMSYMFEAFGIKSPEFCLNLGNWNTSNVRNMSWMFMGAGTFATTWNVENLSSWDTSKVTDMSYMFGNAGYSATTWNIGYLSNWNTSSVKNLAGMFENAGAYATTWNIGNLSNWDTSKVIDMSNMFYDAGSKATNLNLNNWNISQVADMSGMFYNFAKEATVINLYLNNWNVPSANKSSMFLNSNPLMQIYVKNAAMKTWLETGTSIPIGVTIIPLG